MPTSADLVTDLPADFEVFGQAVDTDFVDLLGGTTGQVLSKTSATDLDFTWVTANPGDITGVTAGTGISGGGTSGTVTVSIDTAVTADLTTSQTLTNKTLTSPALTTPTISTLTTNGDLLYGTGSGALARKAIGSTGQVLTVASGIPSWATPASGLVLISRQTFTGVATTGTTFDGVFTSTYKTYMAVFENVGASTYTDDFQIQLRYAGPNTQAATYYGTTVYSTQAGGPTNSPSNNTAQFTLALEADCSGNMYFNRVGNASEKGQMYGTGVNASGYGPLLWGCNQDTARTYTGFLLKSSSSNITGTVAVYGLATS